MIDERRPLDRARAYPTAPGARSRRSSWTILDAELEALGAETIAAIGVEIAEYARPLEGRFGRNLRRGVEESLRRFVVMAGDEDAAAAPLPAIYRQLGAGEWRDGRSLDALQAAYRLGARVAWRRLGAAAAGAGASADVLRLLAESIFAYIDELAGESVAGYAQAQAAGAGALEGRRRALAELLLRSPAADRDAVAAAARDAGWQLPRELAAIALAVPDDALAGAIDPGALTAAGAILLPDPGGPGRRAAIERALSGRAAAVGPAVPPREAARSLRWARATLDLDQPGGGLSFADERLVELALAAAREPLAALRAQRLAALDVLPAAQARAARGDARRMAGAPGQRPRRRGGAASAPADRPLSPRPAARAARRTARRPGGAARSGARPARASGAAPGRARRLPEQPWVVVVDDAVYHGEAHAGSSHANRQEEVARGSEQRGGVKAREELQTPVRERGRAGPPLPVSLKSRPIGHDLGRKPPERRRLGGARLVLRDQAGGHLGARRLRVLDQRSDGVRSQRVVVVEVRDPQPAGVTTRLHTWQRRAGQPRPVRVGIDGAVGRRVDAKAWVSERLQTRVAGEVEAIARDDHFDVLVGLRERRGDRAFDEQVDAVRARGDADGDERVGFGVRRLVARIGTQAVESPTVPRVVDEQLA